MQRIDGNDQRTSMIENNRASQRIMWRQPPSAVSPVNAEHIAQRSDKRSTLRLRAATFPINGDPSD
jgi:hypothetical protein